MKKSALFLLAAILLCGIGAGPAQADPGRKLSRGVHNVLFGWFEIVNEIGNEADRRGPLLGLGSGLIRGTAFAVARILVGVFETVTFPLPNGNQGYDPLLQPDSVFARR